MGKQRLLGNVVDERLNKGFVASITGFTLLILLILHVCCGCVPPRQYTVVLRNGQQVPASTRPKVDKATAMYHFKDAAGRPVVVPAQAIKEIEVR